jgi:hypothetical protein
MGLKMDEESPLIFTLMALIINHNPINSCARFSSRTPSPATRRYYRTLKSKLFWGTRSIPGPVVPSIIEAEFQQFKIEGLEHRCGGCLNHKLVLLRQSVADSDAVHTFMDRAPKDSFGVAMMSANRRSFRSVEEGKGFQAPYYDTYLT